MLEISGHHARPGVLGFLARHHRPGRRHERRLARSVSGLRLVRGRVGVAGERACAHLRHHVLHPHLSGGLRAELGGLQQAPGLDAAIVEVTRHHLAQLLRVPDEAGRGLLDGPRELERGVEALLAISLQRLEHHRVEVGTHFLVPLRGRLHFLAERRHHALFGRLAVEEPQAGEALVHHHAQREDVAARVERLTANLLGRHVARRALHHADAGAAAAAQRLGDAEVEQLGDALVGHHDVLLGDVAVNDDLPPAARVGEGVRVVQRQRRVARGGERQPDGNGFLRLAAGARHLDQGAALDELHRHVELAFVGIELEDLGDVRVVEDGGDARLFEEHAHEVFFTADVGKNGLEHHQLLEAGQARLVGQIDGAHATCGKATEHLVLAQVPAIERCARRDERVVAHP